MESLHSLDNSQCGELERLAAAAAAMDYTHTITSVESHSSQENGSHPVGQPPPPHSTQNQIALDQEQRPTSMASVPQVISYIEPYHIPRGHHLVPIRAYEAQTFIQDQPQTIQSLTGSRVVMVATNNRNPQPAVQFPRQITHFAVAGVQYQGDQSTNENCQPYSQVLSPSAQILHFTPAEESTIPPAAFVAESLNDSPSLEENLGQTKGLRKNPKRKIDECATADQTNAEAQPTENAANNDEALIPCNQCKALFDSEEACKLHQLEHNVPKRHGLPLELKIEIIKRINSGERKADMAEEYSVNTSTIKSIMKKADTYLACWKKGMFKPDSKKLKGPKREDVEEALFSWYKQAIENDAVVSGAILCTKAVDFARKLGHTDFKPTHGWLDRFKKRKKIVFGRGASKRRREEKTQDCISSISPQMLTDYESNDIFTVELLGLFYRALPSAVDTLRGNRCPGGVRARERLSLVLCTNMSGNEKVPLVVVGKQRKGIELKNAKNLPVLYVSNKHAWLNSEIFNSWLHDMDSWFVQQGRKVILLAPPSPIYSHPPKLRAIKFAVMSPGYPSPLKQIVVPYFKKFYRKKFLEESMLVSSGLRKCPKSFCAQLSFLSCLELLASTWQSLSENIIVSSFQRSGLTKYGLWGMIVPTDNADAVGLQEMFISAIHVLEDVPGPETTFNDFVHFDDDVQVCNLMGDDDILAKVKGVLEEEEEYSEDDDDDKENDQIKEGSVARPSFAEVENALSTLRRYIQYQEGAQEMFRVLAHLEYFIYKSVSDQSTSNHLPH